MSMAREEAIALLNEQYETCKRIYDCSADQRKSYPNVPQFMEALGMALSALRPVSREQVEKVRGEWQVCFEDWRKQIAGDQCSKCGFQHYGTSINLYKFCPHCGAPMTDEAVDILLGRLEALHEDNGCS